MTTSRPYKTELLPGVSECIYSVLGSVDGCGAQVQLYSVLPWLHDRRSRHDSHCGEKLPVYVGRFGWVDIGFSYIELAGTLLVFTLWPNLLSDDERTHEVDCVLDDRAVPYLLAHTNGGLL